MHCLARSFKSEDLSSQKIFQDLSRSFKSCKIFQISMICYFFQLGYEKSTKCLTKKLDFSFQKACWATDFLSKPILIFFVNSLFRNSTKIPQSKSKVDKNFYSDGQFGIIQALFYFFSGAGSNFRLLFQKVQISLRSYFPRN